MNLIILGAGGYGRTVADIAEQTRRYSKIQFLEDNCKEKHILGKCSDYVKHISPDTEMYPAFGNNEARLKWIEIFKSDGIMIPTFIHGTAYVSPKAVIECGTVVLPQAIINTDVLVKKGCIINCGAIIDHGCIVEEGVHVCLSAVIKSDNRIPKGMKVEAGTVIENNTYSLKGRLT